MEGRFPEWMLKDLRNALQNQCVFGLCRLLSFSNRCVSISVRGPITGNNNPTRVHVIASFPSFQMAKVAQRELAR